MAIVTSFQQWLRTSSIRQKLQYSILAFSLMVLLSSALTFAWSANRYFHTNTQRELVLLASVLAENSKVAVAFNDAESASNILSAIEKVPEVLWASIYKNNAPFAAYPAVIQMDVSTTALPDQRVWQEANLYYASYPIVVNDQVIGQLLLKSALNTWGLYWKPLILVVMILLMIIAVLSFFMSHWLKKNITLPLLALSDWAVQVYQHKQFDARADKKSDDEIGRLTDSLNAMMAELSKQESIISLNKSLEDEITGRKQTEKALIDMRDKAERANKAKSIFLANMSHEIRTPMNAIIGFVDLVLEGELNEEPRRYLQTVRGSANDLHNLLNDILDIAKLEQGKLDLEPRPFQLRPVLDKVLQTFSLKAKAKGLQLEIHLSPDTPSNFIGDALRLNHILMNLIGNAVKFTTSGCVRITVTYSAAGELEFEVSDTGIGIAADKLGHIFDSFIQADSSTSRKFGGTGLGTTIAKQLVERMDGKIWVESVEGVGSRFCFSLKLPVAESEAFIEEQESIQSEFLHTNGPLSILIAEDVRQNAELLRIRLEALGHQITWVENGRLAVEAFIGGDFDLILMDIQMPEMDGLEAAKAIRAFPEGQSIPIIALTASVMYEDKVACRNAGMDGFENKPIIFNNLFLEMTRLLEGRVDRPLVNQQSPLMKNVSVSITEESATYGVDFDEGQATWGDTLVYRRNLKQFAKRHKNDLYLIIKLLETDQIDDAAKVLHALKGTSGNLAMKSIYEGIVAISDILKQGGKQGALQQLQDLKPAYLKTLETITAIPAEISSGEGADLLSVQALLEQLDTLAQWLQQGQIEDELCREVMSQLQHQGTPRVMLSSFVEAIDTFEFDQAVHSLHEIQAWLMQEVRDCDGK